MQILVKIAAFSIGKVSEILIEFHKMNFGIKVVKDFLSDSLECENGSFIEKK